jgi:hypothetical protein
MSKQAMARLAISSALRGLIFSSASMGERKSKKGMSYFLNKPIDFFFLSCGVICFSIPLNLLSYI